MLHTFGLLNSQSWRSVKECCSWVNVKSHNDVYTTSLRCRCSDLIRSGCCTLIATAIHRWRPPAQIGWQKICIQHRAYKADKCNDDVSATASTQHILLYWHPTRFILRVESSVTDSEVFTMQTTANQPLTPHRTAKNTSQGVSA